MDFKGQLALEYLLIFFVLLIILSTVTVPFLSESIESTNDITKSVEIKSMLTEVEKNVRLINVLDFDSKRTVSIYVPEDLVLYHTTRSGRNYIYTTITLSDNSKKRIELEMPCKVTFNDNSNHYYSSLKKRWYYNVEIKWIESSTGERSININFK